MAVADIITELPGDLAYNTVQTILSRLHLKGVVAREQQGRTHFYTPVLDEAGIAARRIREVLDRTGDSATVLLRFVPTLTPHEEAAIRTLLNQHAERVEEQ